jgi:predicted translin family RNA/ssDNA-binding protein
MAKIKLDDMRRELEKFDKTREEIIRDCRKVIISSKTAIGQVHRDELFQAEKTIASMKSSIDDIKKKIGKVPRLEFEGTYKVAIQEYVEALSLLQFVKNNEIISYSDDFSDPENYLMGLCDLSGELVRKAINSSIKENYDMAISIRKALEDLYVELSKFDLRNGELRRKYDGIKYDIKKLDDLVFQLKMKDKI